MPAPDPGLTRTAGTRLNPCSLAGRPILALVLVLMCTGCMGYRLVPLDELALPSYERGRY
jgi:hypothetical protein